MFHLNRIKNYLILLLLFNVLFIVKVSAIVSPTNDFYVNDYANILSNDTKNYIINQSQKIESADGTQIVVVTVKNLEGLSIEDYSLKLFRNFKIGDSSKNNGLLLLLSYEDRKFRVEVGYGLEGILPDGKTGRLIDEYIIPYLKEDKFDEGIKNGYDAFYSEIVKLNNLDIPYNEAVPSTSSDSSFALAIIGALIGLLFGYLIRKYTFGKVKVLSILSYIIIYIILFIFGMSSNNINLITLIFPFNPILFISGLIKTSDSMYTGGFFSGGSSGFSSGGFSGGGGSSGGGGASRGF